MPRVFTTYLATWLSKRQSEAMHGVHGSEHSRRPEFKNIHQNRLAREKVEREFTDIIFGHQDVWILERASCHIHSLFQGQFQQKNSDE